VFYFAIMEELKRMNHLGVGKKLSLTDEEFDLWLGTLGLAYTQRICECGGGMTLESLGNSEGGQVNKRFRCKRRECRKKIGYRAGTFFEGARLSAKDIFHLSYFWSLDCSITYEQIAKELLRDDNSTLGPNTIVVWMNFFREVCARYFIDHPAKLGGVGKVVEIDETLITRRKYNRRRFTGEQWLFGGVERGSNKCFLIPVEHRNADTLLPIIQNFVMPGTIVMSDLWAAYNGITNLPEGYQHLTVNHSVNFVDPDSGACTNTIESTWQKFKHEHKKRYGTQRSTLLSYVYQFPWKKLFRGQGFFHLWDQISHLG